MDRQPSSDQRWLWRAGLIAVAVTALAAVMLSRDGTGCRPPPDDEPEPDSIRRGRMHAAATPRGSGRSAADDSEDDLEAGFKQR